MPYRNVLLCAFGEDEYQYYLCSCIDCDLEFRNVLYSSPLSKALFLVKKQPFKKRTKAIQLSKSDDSSVRAEFAW